MLEIFLKEKIFIANSHGYPQVMLAKKEVDPDREITLRNTKTDRIVRLKPRPVDEKTIRYAKYNEIETLIKPITTWYDYWWLIDWIEETNFLNLKTTRSIENCQHYDLGFPQIKHLLNECEKFLKNIDAAKAATFPKLEDFSDQEIRRMLSDVVNTLKPLKEYSNVSYDFMAWW